MFPKSGRIIHLGINYMLAPPPGLTKERFLDFQKELNNKGLSFTVARREESTFIFEKENESPNLQVRIGLPAPPIGQLLIIDSHPRSGVKFFIEQSEAVCSSFSQCWEKKFQVIRSDVTIRHLYQSKGQHAFKYLWETRLGQKEKDLSSLGRAVLGGGIRLVMPPKKDERIPKQVEIKIESFLKDTRMIFVETQFVWLQPMVAGEDFAPKQLLTEVDSYAQKEALNFILKKSL